MVQSFVVGKQQFRIVGNDRTVEVIVRVALIQVVAHTGIEDEIHLLIQQTLNVSVHQLCRVANRIRWNGALSLLVGFPGAFL